MTAPQPSSPPQQVQQGFQGQPQPQQQMPMQNEPLAANDGFGAFSAF